MKIKWLPLETYAIITLGTMTIPLSNSDRWVRDHL